MTNMNAEGAEGRPGEDKTATAIRNQSHQCSKSIVTALLSVVPPASLPLEGGPTQRKKLSAPRISLSLDQSEDDLGETPDDLDINVDDMDTPEEGDYLDYTDHEMDWEGGSIRILSMLKSLSI